MLSAQSRLRAAQASSAKAAAEKETRTKRQMVEDFISQRDFAAAGAVLEFSKSMGGGGSMEGMPINPWLAYCAFHGGDYERAAAIYREMLEESECDTVMWVYLACCLFHLGKYAEADAAAAKGPALSLRNRVHLHCAQKTGNESKLMECHAKLQETFEDQLSLAAIYYLRGQFQDSIDIYKRIMLEQRDYIALNVYAAMCYYKIECFEVSVEVLNVYLAQFPDSPTAVNVKACNQMRQYSGRLAEQELRLVTDGAAGPVDNLFARHNQVVFSGGEGARQVLPQLVDVLPEARLNLVIYHLKRDEVQEAYDLIKNIEPVSSHEHILKGVVNAIFGQQSESREHLRMAQTFFQYVGGSPTDCDTIPGRQCMASCFFILKQFAEVLTYLDSIKEYFATDDVFNINYGVACAAVGSYADARDALQRVRDPRMRQEYYYLSWLARSYLHAREPKKAWDLYLKMETTSESFSMLQLIAADAYRVGLFYYAAKAYDALERLDPNPEYWDGKRGACVGVFQLVVAQRADSEQLRDVLGMLRNSKSPQAEQIIRVMKSWAKANNVRVG